MPTIKQISKGRKAKSAGSFFEHAIEHQANRENIMFIKIPDGCRRVRTPIGLKLIPVKTPFDFVIGKNGTVCFFDAKSFDKNRLTRSDVVLHQITSLYSFETEKFIAGYLVYFRPINEIVFFDASQLVGLEKTGISLNAEDGTYLGSIEKFNISKLFIPAAINQ